MFGTFRKYFKLKRCIKQLRSENMLVRKAAVQTLMDLEDPRAVEPLIATLKDEEPSVAAMAALALGKIHDVRAVPYLITALEFRYGPPGEYYLTKYDPVSKAARDALVMFGVPAAEELARLIVGSLPHEINYRKIIALGAIGGPVANEAMLSVLSCWRNWGKDVNGIDSLEFTIDVLCKTGDRRAIDPLIDLLGSEGYHHAKIAASGLRRLGWGKRITSERIALAIAEERFLDAAEEGEAAVGPLIEKLWANCEAQENTVNQHWHLNKAGEALIHVGKPAVKPLAAVLTEGAPEKRNSAAMVLGQIGNVDAVEFLIDALGDLSQGLIEYQSDWYHQETIGHMEGQFVSQASSIALKRILEKSAGEVVSGQLMRIASLQVVDIRNEKISDVCSIYTILVHGVDNSQIKQLARQELFRRGIVT